MTKGNEKELHPRNLHNQNYDFNTLAAICPELTPFIRKNKYENLCIEFSDPKAVLALNKALLLHHYNVQNWTIPKGHLCPPIPGRADYIHYIADLISEKNGGKPLVGTKVKGLDIGTGTGCIYPILGNRIYGWRFVGTDINSESINHCKKILNSNPSLKKNIKLRFQDSEENIFKDIIKTDEKFHFTMCNPPFYSSLTEAKNATDRKVKNLNISKVKKGHIESKIKTDNPSNFGGKDHELWCPGGASAFIKRMILQSVDVRDQCEWFTTLVPNKDLLPELDQEFKVLDCAETRTVEMIHGKKSVHLLAWRIRRG